MQHQIGELQTQARGKGVDTNGGNSSGLLPTPTLPVLQNRTTTTGDSEVACSLRLEVPRFNGTNPFTWIFRIQQYFDFVRTAEEQRLRIVAFHMEGIASEWFQWMSNNNLLTGWADFLQQVKLRFGPSQFEDYQGALSKLNQ
uniref:Retrotransposon gag domain-containing protein n=1 Tax=Nelumbo nucifera TaxID=4432 RepID=A0A822XK63_NELNU|nr:TPA_asm: hypothetical protein HUJ06_019411 [Nelumbo nucifera]